MLTEEIIYKILSELRVNPKIKAEDIHIEQDDFIEALEIINDEGLAKGIKIIHDGSRKVYAVIRDFARLTLSGIRFLDKRHSEPSVISMNLGTCHHKNFINWFFVDIDKF